MIEVPVILFIVLVIFFLLTFFALCWCFICDLKEKIFINKNNRLNMYRRVDSIFAEVHFFEQKLKKVDDKIQQIIDYINDNESSVKEDD